MRPISEPRNSRVRCSAIVMAGTILFPGIHFMQRFRDFNSIAVALGQITGVHKIFIFFALFDHSEQADFDHDDAGWARNYLYVAV